MTETTGAEQRLSEADIRIHALNLAVSQRRESWSWLIEQRRKDESEPELGWLARETLVDARLYADWIRDGDVPIETPEQSAAIVGANLERMGLTLGGTKDES